MKFNCFIIILNFLYLSCESRPNFVIFMADDLGIGDVGCFGNNTIKTPNIDQIAKEGVKLTHHIAASSVCTPSRAAFLTGRYPIRSGMAPEGLLKVFIFLASSGGLPANETTIPSLLQKSGYSTALIGKWHLGVNCEGWGDFCHHPLKHGFDYFYGLPLTNLKDFGDDGGSVIISEAPFFYQFVFGGFVISVTMGLYLIFQGSKCSGIFIFIISVILPMTLVFFAKNIKILNGVIMRNYDVVEQPINLETLTPRLVSEAVQFLQHQVNREKPFLLFMSFVQVHTALHSSKGFVNHSVHGRYGDNVEELDWSIGEIMKTLDKLGFKDDTFVYLTSDQGAHIEERGMDGQREGGYNGIYRGGKCQGAMEGGIRVPAAIYWPKKFKSGLEIDEPTSLMDVFPTIMELADIEIHKDILDGKSLVPLLHQTTNISEHEFMFHYCGLEIHGARFRPRNEHAVWKVLYATPKWEHGTEGCKYVCHCFGNHVEWHNPPLLYNIFEDPAEVNPLEIHPNSKYQDIINKIDAAVKAHKNSVKKVPSQYSLSRTVWKPWLQPCCNFPSCSCQESRQRH